jgi:hypothetical protein
LNWLQGGLPVAISMTVQATDQMSACRPWPDCLMTSGAIQYGVPLIDLDASESARAPRASAGRGRRGALHTSSRRRLPDRPDAPGCIEQEGAKGSGMGPDAAG